MDQPDTVNPFIVPNAEGFIKLQQNLKEKHDKYRESQKTLPIHLKHVGNKRTGFRRKLLEELNTDDDEFKINYSEKSKEAIYKQKQIIIQENKKISSEKQSIRDYIGKKREMFFLQYSIDVKQNEIKNLEQIAHEEEKKLQVAEQCLEQDAALFDEFLKANDKSAVEAVTKAEQQVKIRLAMDDELRTLTTQQLQVQADINRNEFKLNDFRGYRNFLEALIPEPFRSQRAATLKAMKETKRRNREAARTDSSSAVISSSVMKTARSKTVGLRRMSRRLATVRNQSSVQDSTPTENAIESNGQPSKNEIQENEISSDEDEDLEPYFTDPQQLLDILKDLEVSNLSLIQNCQDSEETYEDLVRMIESAKTRNNQEITALTSQIDHLKSIISDENKQISDLDYGTQTSLVGTTNVEEQRIIMEEIHHQIKDVYQECIHQDDKCLSSLQMLAEIETLIEKLFEKLKIFPPDHIKAIRNERELARREKCRLEKLEEEKRLQEVRVNRALERSRATPKKTMSRRIVSRSKPPEVDQGETESVSSHSFEDEEFCYFFT